jgi:hypothetical protein
MSRWSLAIPNEPWRWRRFDIVHMATGSIIAKASVANGGCSIPLRKAPPFDEPDMIHALIQQSDGITGRVTWLIRRAAEIAIGDAGGRSSGLIRLNSDAHVRS